MTAWISGPWHRDGLNIMAGETIVARVTGTASNQQAVADAQLISVAPELYDALAALVNEVAAWLPGVAETDAMKNARAVLLKAETL